MLVHPGDDSGKHPDFELCIVLTTFLNHVVFSEEIRNISPATTSDS